VLVPDPARVPYPRVQIGDTTRLARTIQDRGLDRPLLVMLHDGEHVLVDGFRRYAALEGVKATNRLYWRKQFEEVDGEPVEGLCVRPPIRVYEGAGKMVSPKVGSIASRNSDTGSLECSPRRRSRDSGSSNRHEASQATNA
jgi:hypothetical protein